MTPYGVTDLGKHCFRLLLVTITWTNVHVSSSDIHPCVLSYWILKLSIPGLRFEIYEFEITVACPLVQWIDILSLFHLCVPMCDNYVIRMTTCNKSNFQIRALNISWSLQWRHNGHDGVSNHQPRYCLLNRLFRRKSKKISKLPVTGPLWRNPPVTGEFPSERASNAENVSIWWRHHDNRCGGWIICVTDIMKENFWIWNKMSLKYVPEGLIDNMATLVQIMAWRRTSDKPLSEVMMVYFTDVYMRHLAPMS